VATLIGKDTYLTEKRLSFEVDGLFLLYILFIAVITFWVYVFVFRFPSIGAQVAGILLFIVFIILKKPIEKRLRLTRSYNKGLHGEEKVRNLLIKELPDTYTVYENVVVPPLKSNIDFVVVGPLGIYTVEVKSHIGSITDDGHQLLLNGVPFKEGDILHQAYGESQRINDYLLSKNISTPEIKPLLVFSNKYTTMYFGKKPVRGVFVIGVRWLLDILKRNNTITVIRTEQIEQIKSELTKIVFQSTKIP
jgi:hypothetical protein